MTAKAKYGVAYRACAGARAQNMRVNFSTTARLLLVYHNICVYYGLDAGKAQVHQRYIYIPEYKNDCREAYPMMATWPNYFVLPYDIIHTRVIAS